MTEENDIIEATPFQRASGEQKPVAQAESSDTRRRRPVRRASCRRDFHVLGESRQR